MYSPILPSRGDVVGHDDVGAAVDRVHLLDQLAQQRGAHRVQPRVGLVEDHDVRVHHERPRESGALAHPAGELRRRVVHRMPESPTSIRPCVDALAISPRAGRCAGEAGRRRCRTCTSNRTARRPGRARRSCACSASSLGIVRFGTDWPVHDDVARVGKHQADDVLDQHALARSRRAEHDGDRVVGERDVQAVQHRHAAQPLVHVDAADRPLARIRARPRVRARRSGTR